MMSDNTTTRGGFTLSGAIAGAVSVLIFTWIHDLFISDIWSMLVVMLVAAAVCGLCVGWSYGRLVASPSLKSWLVYNLVYDAMFLLLGVVSVLIFEPVTTIAALSASNGPPDKLILQAMPLTAVFTLLAAVLIVILYGRAWRQFPAVLLTCAVLVLLLGLNVSVLGFVTIPRGSFYLVMEFFGLILLLNAAFVLAFIFLEQKRLFQSTKEQQQVTA